MSKLMDIVSHCEGIEITDEAMDKVLDFIHDAQTSGAHYPNMTYEEGIEATLEWLSGEREEDPTE